MARATTQSKRNDGTRLVQLDPLLQPYAPQLRQRFAHYRKLRRLVADDHDSLDHLSRGYEYFGFTRGARDQQPGVWYREWAPAAHSLALIGDFNDWDRNANPLQRDQFGVWHTFLPDRRYAHRLTHASHVKVHVVSNEKPRDRIPAYIRRVVQDQSLVFCGQYWNPPQPFTWQHDPPTTRQGALRIYEAHVGMAQEQEKVGSYREFQDNILPRIVGLGYNAVQLMAVMEHPYYASFGYHVSNFFAPSSRFGTPDQLKALIDAAHGMGLAVIMDIIHSHSVKNVAEGLNRFDGTGHQYFHAGARGEHHAWDSLCFDYSKYEVLRFLLSNIRYWLEEFHFDGFRFDGVTSMMYLDHGLERSFSCYDDYFSDNLDLDAVAYLTLANELAHHLKTNVITIAEDVSGMPGLGRPINEGGLGFDYRLAMGVPDYWIKTLKHRTDEQWDLPELWHTLLDRRTHEKHIGYVESHDQALVGDKTIAFRLMDEHMYTGMSVFSRDPVVDRGIALHKMIRLITFSLAGEAWLNFIGNEFGHPEWIDFPRQGNNFSYRYAHRQWSLVDRDDLRYKGLRAFDRVLNTLDRRYAILNDPFIEQLALHNDTRQLIYRRGPLVFAFNFHPTESYPDLRIPVPDPTDYQLILNTDEKQFEGFGAIQGKPTYPQQNVPMYNRPQTIQLYLPARTAQVLAPANLAKPLT